MGRIPVELKSILRFREIRSKSFAHLVFGRVKRAGHSIWLTAFLLSLGALPARVCADTLRLKSGTAHTGTFRGYKNDHFLFQAANGQVLDEMRARVDSLQLDPPAVVSVKVSGQKKRDDLKFCRYTNGQFFFEEKGKEIVMRAITVASIQLGLDFSRPAMELASTVVPPDDPNPEIEKYVTTGVVTVIHFHKPGLISSVRQGNYVGELAHQSRGKIELVQIDIPDFDCPAARKYQITSAPQFWFYDRRGRLVTKLTERFTENDIEAALRQAQR